MTNITPARLADLPEILRLVRALSAFHGDTATVTLEELQSFFFDPGAPATALLAHDAHQVVGYAGLLPHIRLHSAERTLDIQHLYVVETHRNRGVGRALVEAARAVATRQGCFRMTIGTDPDNSAAQAAYRAMGWEEITQHHPRFKWLLSEAEPVAAPPP